MSMTHALSVHSWRQQAVHCHLATTVPCSSTVLIRPCELLNGVHEVCKCVLAEPVMAAKSSTCVCVCVTGTR